MNKLITLLLLAGLSGCAASHKATSGTKTPKEKQYVVILSMDAFRWDLAGRSHTPTLDSLARVGTYAEIYPVYPSNTFPSHYAMATGLHPNNHGVVNNGYYDRLQGRNVSVFDSLDVRIPGFWGGEPIWNTAERQGLTAHIYMWPGSEVPVNGRQATIWTRYSKHPTYYQRADKVLASMTRPEAEIPELVMWYFEEPDAAMHNYGPTSKEAIARAEHIDSALCYFFREIRRSPVYDRINFIVTADHGMAELSKDRYLNLYPLLDSTQVIRAVTGSPFGFEVRPEYVQKALRILRGTGRMQAWAREKMPARFHYGTHPTRLTNIIAIPETGWRLDYSPRNNPPTTHGAHGFDNRDRDMHMVFYATGPAFRKGFHQKTFENQNMYLIMCHLLGIEPAQNDGRWSGIKAMFEK